MLSLGKRLQALLDIVTKIKSVSTFSQKLHFLNLEKNVQLFVQKSKIYPVFIQNHSIEAEYILKSLVVIGERSVFEEKDSSLSQKWIDLIEKLWEIEMFYQKIGGVIGYQYEVLKLLQVSRDQKYRSKMAALHTPAFVNLSKEGIVLRKMIYWGLLHLPKMCEFYPVGGAADRLHLQDEKTKKELPAALLRIGEKTLLESLIFDLQAKEYLYYKIFGKKIITPIVMMTSSEKQNDAHIRSICERSSYFLRPKETIQIIKQPCVPTITEEGLWCFKEPVVPLMKPGGHGAIWKLAKERKIFEWLKAKKRTKALIRQINNPISGIDHSLLAFTGHGLQKEQTFGFLSCPRRLKASEGMIAIVENEENEVFLTNIEYCDFQKYGIEDIPYEKEGKYSKFTSNVNILFADLEEVKKAVSYLPFPGALINLKKTRFFSKGIEVQKKIARLETTMQNISDAFREKASQKIVKNISMKKSFVAFNRRIKTISPAKKASQKKVPSFETPERCFYDLMKNGHELLEMCGFKVSDLKEFNASWRPSSLFRYHPALGPLYSIIRQKLKGGILHKNSELILNISEIEIENLDLKGSCRIEADQIMGEVDEKNILHYSENVGRCILKNVTVQNEGIEDSKDNVYWKNEYKRKEELLIHLEQNAEFVAENVVFSKNQAFFVEKNTRLFVTMSQGEFLIEKSKIEVPSWKWSYKFDSSFMISLVKKPSQKSVKVRATCNLVG